MGPLAVVPGFNSNACTDLWNPFSVERYLAQRRHLWRVGLVLPQQGAGDSTDLVYFPGEVITLLKSVRGLGCREEGKRGRGKERCSRRRRGRGNWD